MIDPLLLAVSTPKPPDHRELAPANDSTPKHGTSQARSRLAYGFQQQYMRRHTILGLNTRISVCVTKLLNLNLSAAKLVDLSLALEHHLDLWRQRLAHDYRIALTSSAIA